MSLIRAALVTVEAVCNQLACTPPNPTPSKGRYHTDELYILQIAPFIFKIHQLLTWTCAAFEVIFYLLTLLPASAHTTTLTHLACLPNSQPTIHTTPMFIIGVLAVALGTYIRLDCFRALGQLFTFDLTIHPEHKLITSRFYGYVRHPAYTGSILLVAGLAFSHLTDGSWLTQCGGLSSGGSALAVWALWWMWTLCVGFSRADAEDKQMKKLFGAEWEAYAIQVPWWFFPGLI
ncbi:hypothetical protein BD779DRAFT_1451852 [Infundibulicybe gibba]|nr:hypothetical protein BD779DRAFT_1451852 [Infundibulicybe gibba]